MRKIVLVLVALSWLAAASEQRPGWLGLGFTRETDGARQWLQVRIIVSGGPADKAGLAVQDVITAIDGKPLAFKDDLDLLEFLGRIQPAHDVCFDVLHKQAHKTVCVTPSEMTADFYDRWKLNLQVAAQKRKEAAAMASRDRP